MQTVEKHTFFNQILLEHSFKFHWKKKKSTRNVGRHTVPIFINNNKAVSISVTFSMCSFLTQFCVWSIRRITATRSYNFARVMMISSPRCVRIRVKYSSAFRGEERLFPFINKLDKNHPRFHVTPGRNILASTNLAPPWTKRRETGADDRVKTVGRAGLKAGLKAKFAKGWSERNR